MAPTAESKKGDVAEIRVALRLLAVQGSSKETMMAKRDLFKRVISCVTAGMDLSPLFSELLLAASPKDIVQKKMLYTYVAHYAAARQELALLTINMLQKDCRDEDPLVRGLALRALVGLRVPALLEYAHPPLRAALGDPSAYVRKVAVLAVLKLRASDPKAAEELMRGVRGLLTSERDPAVLSNVVTVIRAVDGPGALLHKAVLYELLNRLRDMSDWAQADVLDLAAMYTPTGGEPEVYDLLNSVEDRLASSSPGVALAAAKVMLHLTSDMPALHQQVYDRLKAPLLTLAAAGPPEMTAVVLDHVMLLARRAPALFADDHKLFYVRYTDPAYVKRLKLHLLAAIADGGNAHDTASELCECAGDADVTVAKCAVRSLARVACAVPDAEGLVDRLATFVASHEPALAAEALVGAVDVARAFPGRGVAMATAAIGVAPAALAAEPAARSAHAWLLSTFCGGVPDAPYALESSLYGLASEPDCGVRRELLAAGMRLLMARPLECRAMAGAALAAGATDPNADVRDRAAMYGRLLAHGVADARRVVATPAPTVDRFVDATPDASAQAVFTEFATLSVVYNAPWCTFAPPGGDDGDGPPVPPSSWGAPGSPPSGGDGGDDIPAAEVDLLTGDDKDVGGGGGDPFASLAAAGAAAGPPEPGSYAADVGDLLGGAYDAPPQSATAVSPLSALHAAMGLGPTAGGADSSSAVRTLVPGGPVLAPEVVAPSPVLPLAPRPQLSPAHFQSLWGSLPTLSSTEELLPALGSLHAAGVLVRHLAGVGIATVASGGVAPSFKLYVYAQPMDPGGQAVNGGGAGYVLMEILANSAAGAAALKVKAEVPHHAGAVLALVRQRLSCFGTA